MTAPAHPHGAVAPEAGGPVVLVVNSGSSSLKYQLVRLADDECHRVAKGLIERIGETESRLVHERIGREPVDLVTALPDHDAALRLMLDTFAAHGPSIEGLAAVGHRVVHGGRRFTEPVVVDTYVESEIERLIPLAPLHNPANLLGLRVLRRLLPGVPHVAAFDTAFHSTIPEVAATYALPQQITADYAIRRYGFHGTSHKYVSGRAAQLLGVPREQANLIVCHIGNGASVTAVQAGRSVDTSMGLSPLEGLVMGTRSGDIDPAIVFHLHRVAGLSMAEIDVLLNRESGLKGLCGDSDVRTVRGRADAGDPAARLALAIYAYRIRKYVGAYLAVVPGVQAVVFTAGVGENDADLRAEVCRPLAHLGIGLSEQLNRAPSRQARFVDDGSAPVRTLVVPTDEEAEIARETIEVARDAGLLAAG